MSDTKSKIHSPKDVEILKCILKDMGISEYEPRVITQLLEFTYKYVSGILEDARVYSSHAKKKQLDLEDVKLAVQLQLDRTFTTPPPRDLLLEIARTRNSVALPPMKLNCGIRLPPDRYCLTATNYKLKPPKRLIPRTQNTALRQQPNIMKGKPAMAAPQVRVTKPPTPGVTRILHAPSPVLKVSSGAPGEMVAPIFQTLTDSGDSYIKIEPTVGMKRKREEDYVGQL